jgi:hypothetical protein
MSNSLHTRVISQLVQELNQRGHHVSPDFQSHVREILEVIDGVPSLAHREVLLDALESRRAAGRQYAAQ